MNRAVTLSSFQNAPLGNRPNWRTILLGLSALLLTGGLLSCASDAPAHPSALVKPTPALPNDSEDAPGGPSDKSPGVVLHTPDTQQTTIKVAPPAEQRFDPQLVGGWKGEQVAVADCPLLSWQLRYWDDGNFLLRVYTDREQTQRLLLRSGRWWIHNEELILSLAANEEPLLVPQGLRAGQPLPVGTGNHGKIPLLRYTYQLNADHTTLTSTRVDARSQEDCLSRQPLIQQKVAAKPQGAS